MPRRAFRHAAAVLTACFALGPAGLAPDCSNGGGAAPGAPVHAPVAPLDGHHATPHESHGQSPAAPGPASCCPGHACCGLAPSAPAGPGVLRRLATPPAPWDVAAPATTLPRPRPSYLLPFALAPPHRGPRLAING